MKLIVGLGNPGKEYTKTRHNVGFNMIDDYLIFKGYNINDFKEKFNGAFIQVDLYGEKVIFLKPLSYMNLSGGVVRKFVDYYKITVNDILIISDDLDLKVGNFKIKDKGSSGGHNGLKDIERNLGTSVYKRIKIGISKNEDLNVKDYVLGNFSKEEEKCIMELHKIIYCVLDDYFNFNFSDLMSKYNRKNR